MPYFKSESNAENCNIYHEDLGSGTPIVFVSGWPFGGSMWEHQCDFFTKKGYRCITYDRRGFGRSDTSFKGYDYDTLAADLNQMISHLGLSNFFLVGFSMGGGEVAKYFANHGGKGVQKVALLGTILPFMMKTGDNDGLPEKEIDGMVEKILDDRAAFLQGFNKSFFGSNVSSAYLEAAFAREMQASLHATAACVNTFGKSDLRDATKAISVPTLILHGTSDKQVPHEFSSDKSSKLIPNATYKKYKGEPHAIFITKRDEVNEELSAFFAANS